MFSFYSKKLSLKTKAALAVSALFVLFIVISSYLILSYFESVFKESISSQQYAHVSSLANSIDDRIRLAQNALLAAAAKAPPDVFTNPAGAQSFLDNRIGVHSIFDNGLFFVSKEGRLIAESPYRAGRRGMDISRWGFVKEAMAGNKPYISDTYVSGHSHGHPAVVLTVPVFDGRGAMAGVMAGSFDLFGNNFLAELSGVRIGKTGYLFVTDKKRIMISHPDKSRIMKPAAQPGVNKMYDRAMSGFEGSGETINSSGTEMLAAYKHLNMAPWILAANYPVSEAYGPLNSTRRYIIIASVAAAVMLLFMTFLILKFLMKPLMAITRHVEQMPRKTGPDRLVSIDSHDEIGILAVAFNSMVEALDQRQRTLKESEEKFRLLADFTSDWEYWLDPESNLVYCSPSCEKITGYRNTEFINNSHLLLRIIHPDNLEMFRNHQEPALNAIPGDDLSDQNIEFRIITREGGIRWLSHSCSPIIGENGVYKGRRVSNRDITERKLLSHNVEFERSFLQAMIDAIPDFVFFKDRDSIYRRCNKAFASIFIGLPEEMILGHKDGDFATTVELADFFQKSDHDVMRLGKSSSYEVNVTLNSGRQITVDTLKVPFRDALGNIIGVIGISRDVTLRKQYEHDLQEEKSATNNRSFADMSYGSP